MTYHDPYQPQIRPADRTSYDLGDPRQVSPQPLVPVNGYHQPVPLLVATPLRPSSSLAVWALVMGLVGFFAGWCMLGIPCLGAIVLGHLALADTKDDVKSGRGLAATGLALGYVAMLPAIILFFWLFAGIIAGIGGATTSP